MMIIIILIIIISTTTTMLSEPMCYMEKHYFCISIDSCCSKYYKLQCQFKESSSENPFGFLYGKCFSGHKYIMKWEFATDIYHL